MAGISFFKTRKPRKFEHKPIYWDPEKERKEEREHRIKRELGLEDLSEYKSSIKGTFVEGTTHLKKSQTRGDTAESRRSKSFRLIMILLFLVLLAWFLFWR